MTNGLTLDDLRDDELVELHEIFDKMGPRVPFAGLRAVIAMLNEVDRRLSDRGLLDLESGEKRW